MKQPKYIFIVILIILVAIVCAGQQRTVSPSQKSTGKIQGVLLDVNDARIVSATVIIENAQFKRELKSGEEGDFEIELPAGVYQIKVEANGFRRFELSPFKVKANVTEMINIHMEVMVFSDPY
jgi:hypothetical protein